MPSTKRTRGRPRWRHAQVTKQAHRDTFDTHVTIGPMLGPRHMTCHDEGPREKVQGRWLSARRASYIRWVSKAIRDTQAERRKWRRQALKLRIDQRFATGYANLPF
jgi:hypothetical protein